MSEPVGREAELRELEARLRGRRGGLIVLSGEAGIGKSALAQWFAERARALGFRVDSGRAWELGEAPAWFPLKACLRALGIDTRALPSLDTEVFGLWEEVLGAIVEQSAAHPLAWVLEDLHAADARTLDLLTFLAHPARTLPFLVLVTARPGGERLLRLGKEGTFVELGALGPSAIAALVEETLGQPLDPKAHSSWHSRTGGNPLFALECARAVKATKNFGALPSTVVQVVLTRVAALPGEARSLLGLGAVLGRELAASTLARMAGVLPARAIDGLLPAVREGLLQETAPGCFRFSHAVVSEAIVGSLSPEERRQAHQKAEAALRPLGDTLERRVERAQHAIGALGALAEAEAKPIVLAAIEAMDRSGAHDRAFNLWRRWSDQMSAPPTIEWLLSGATLARAAGMFQESRTHSLAALGLAEASADARGRAEAALALGAELNPGTVDPALVEALRQALQALGGADPALTCRLEARLAAALQPASDPEIPVQMAKAAIATAQSTRDPRLLAEVISTASAALSDYADVSEIEPLAAKLLELATGLDDTALILRALVRRAVASLELSRFEAFEADVDTALTFARRTGLPRLIWRPLLVGSMRALSVGRFEESQRLIVEVEELARVTDDPALHLSLNAHRALRTLALDDRAAAEPVLEQMLPALERLPAVHTIRPMLRALFAVRMEDRAGARAAMPELLADWPSLTNSSGFRGIAGEAVAMAGDEGQRALMLDLLLPAVDRDNHLGHVPYAYEGPIARVVALLEASLGRTEEAVSRLLPLRERLVLRGQGPWVARVELELARAYAVIGNREASRRWAKEAMGRAQGLGMKDLPRRAEALLGAAPSLPPAAPPPTIASTLVLERQGPLYLVRHGAREARVRESRGLQMLARLVERPGERVHALVLASAEQAPPPESDAGAMLDPTALRQYRARLAELDAALDEAEAGADLGRIARLQAEQEALYRELERAVGKGGRVRRAGSATERARINATRRIKDAVARIKEADPEIGAHLERAVWTGTYCCYRP
ncbi:MAG: AAA family ATPase [Myxococcota bacterium]